MTTIHTTRETLRALVDAAGITAPRWVSPLTTADRIRPAGIDAAPTVWWLVCRSIQTRREMITGTAREQAILARAEAFSEDLDVRDEVHIKMTTWTDSRTNGFPTLDTWVAYYAGRVPAGYTPVAITKTGIPARLVAGAL